ncbi:MAG: LutB/LldF family L-lactate oxidation iron-sulfur protein [Alphaproteobacteria bacterium]|nr:LutB/LldF family L-lactate oxidation iron-sulfur protein [Alphaproteobacteria bacterium]
MYPQEKFKLVSAQKAFNEAHRKKLAHNINKYDVQVAVGKHEFKDLENLKQIAHLKKKQAIDNLGYYLETFEKNVIKNGGEVFWAEDGNEANKYVLDICKKHQAHLIVKSKSMVTEEIHLNDYLKKHALESVETDLGEFIQQLDNEAPYHIVTPAMHKSKEDVARVFHEHLGTPLNMTPQEMTMEARKQLRNKYSEAQIGITGGNFILPDIGGIAVTENEGNARLSMALPKVHIVIVGIEKVIPSYKDLGMFWSLLATYGTGQKITVYNTIATAARLPHETDGPNKFYVILLDNGRTKLLTDPALRQGLYCIRCGACLNTCPIYKSIGGHAYQVTYTGPIGKVISPHLKGFDDYNYLSDASSLCGSCSEVCPVKIPLHKLILLNRQKKRELGHASTLETMAWALWKTAMLNRNMMNMGNGKLKSFFINKLIPNWHKHRAHLKFPPQSFNELFKKSKGNISP